MNDQDRPVLTVEVIDLGGLEIAVSDWLTSYRSLHAEGGLGDVGALLQTILPHVRMLPSHQAQRP